MASCKKNCSSNTKLNEHFTPLSKPAKRLFRKNKKPDPELTPFHCHSQHKELDSRVKRRYRVAVDQPEQTGRQHEHNSWSDPLLMGFLEIQPGPTLNPVITADKQVRRCCFSQISPQTYPKHTSLEHTVYNIWEDIMEIFRHQVQGERACKDGAPSSQNPFLTLCVFRIIIC